MLDLVIEAGLANPLSQEQCLQQSLNAVLFCFPAGG
jgi:hypothetical protein